MQPVKVLPPVYGQISVQHINYDQNLATSDYIS